ncbi:hypothetical protein THAOC_11242, partial [Thalassiosira oceanica]
KSKEEACFSEEGLIGYSSNPEARIFLTPLHYGLTVTRPCRIALSGTISLRYREVVSDDVLSKLEMVAALLPSFVLTAFASSPSILLDENIASTKTQLYQHHQPPSRRRRRLASAVVTLPVLTSLSPHTARAISPQEASESYDKYAANYDDLDGGGLASSLGIDDARRKLLGTARGDVLEIGAGTGLNLPCYDFDNLRSLTLVDISDGMLSQARRRVEQDATLDGTKIKFVRADATSELSSLFGDNRFDTVVDTFSLCVMGNEGAPMCLEELAKVVKRKGDGGRILLIENTRASNPILGMYQDATANAAADVGGRGCVYNQDVGKMVRGTSGLELRREEAFAAGLFRSFVCEKT